MSYNEWVEQAYKNSKSFKDLYDYLSGLKDKTVLHYSHDDADGITSAVLMKFFYDVIGVKKAVFEFPPVYELEEWRLTMDLKKYNPEVVVNTDKGTLGIFDEYTNHIKDFVVIDHHIPQGEKLEKCIAYNPREFCSTSHLIHMLLTKAGARNIYSDFINLLGLRGDWVIRPEANSVSEFVKPFIEETQENFSHLFEKVESRATWFDIDDRKYTTVLNQITEFASAICGTGFQYFYNNKNPKLKKVNQPVFLFETLIKPEIENLDEIKEIYTLDDFIDIFGKKDEIATIIFDYYLNDWTEASKILENNIKLTNIKETTVIASFGENIPLLPLVGSVKLYDYCARNNTKNVVYVMVSIIKDWGVHFSLRQRSDKLNISAGKICSYAAEKLGNKYKDKERVTGGGHNLAAEFKFRITDVSPLNIINDFLDILRELESLSKNPASTDDEKQIQENIGLILN